MSLLSYENTSPASSIVGGKIKRKQKSNIQIKIFLSENP